MPRGVIWPGTRLAGVSNAVTRKGSPRGSCLTGSNRIAQTFKNPVREEMN
jgi:hypothetical protein